MRVFLIFIAWCILFVLAWPVALAVLFIAPLVWLVAIPFRLLGVVVAATFALVRAILFLPARVLGHRG